MQSYQKISRHARLVEHMADALGVDLVENLMEGVLTPEELDAAVLSCTGCPNPEDCDHWLETHDDGRAEETPDYCRNAQLFRELRALMRD